METKPGLIQRIGLFLYDDEEHRLATCQYM